MTYLPPDLGQPPAGPPFGGNPGDPAAGPGRPAGVVEPQPVSAASVPNTGATPGQPAPRQDRPIGRGQRPDGAESYPDPPRSWKRSGSLLTGWAAAWCAVLLIGMGWQAVAAPGETDIRTEDPTTPYSLVNTYMGWVFTDKDFDRAANSNCEGYDGPSPKQLAEDMSEWSYSDGSLPDADVGVPEDLGSGRFQIVISVNPGANPQPLAYQLSVDSTADPVCISAVDTIEE